MLVVEDDEGLRSAICAALVRRGFEPIEADSCAAADRAFATGVDVVVTDLRLPDGDALQLLPRLRELDASVPVLIVTGYGTIDLAVRAVKQGAIDFLTKPVDLEILSSYIANAAEQRAARRSGRRPKVLGRSGGEDRERFEARSDAMKRVDEEVEKLRDADCSVLILGETGTGKSLLARRIHAVGARSSGSMVDINCAGLTREFVETELFGHERGAFTGAHAAKQGLLDLAHGGTLFLDEIGTMPSSQQAKLLRVLQTGELTPVGSSRARRVDVRVLSATNVEIAREVRQGSFREDLLYRLNTVEIHLPPLREREEDLLPLASHFLATKAGRYEKPLRGFSADALAMLRAHSWPGNVRELEHVVERAVVLAEGEMIEPADLALTRPANESTLLDRMTLADAEAFLVRRAMDRAGGNATKAAEALGLSRSALYRRLQALGIKVQE